MTRLAPGASVNLSIGARQNVAVSSNGGLFSVTYTNDNGVETTTNMGPLPVRQVFGPNGSVRITNGNAILTYDSPNLPRVGMQLYNPSGLLRWRRQFDDALNNPVSIHCAGDSITYGTGADNIDPNYPTGNSTEPTDTLGDDKSWPGQLRKMFANDFIGAGVNKAGFIHAQQDAVTKVNATVTNRGIHGYAMYVATGGTLTFNLPACTSFDLIWWENNNAANGPSTGTFTYAVDGGAAVPVTKGAAEDTFRMLSVTGLSNATHTVQIAGTNANLSVIHGVRYHSGYGVAVGRFARGGYTLSDCLGAGPNSAQNAPTQGSMLKAFGMIPNALVIPAFGFNDFKYQDPLNRTDLGSFERQLRAVVATAVAAGGCALLLGTTDRDPFAPIPPAGPIPVSAYWDVMKKIAMDTDHCAHARAVDVLGTFAVARAAGLMADSAHPYRQGHGLIAGGLHRLLLSAPGEFGF